MNVEGGAGSGAGGGAGAACSGGGGGGKSSAARLAVRPGWFLTHQSWTVRRPVLVAHERARAERGQHDTDHDGDDLHESAEEPEHRHDVQRSPTMRRP